MLLLLLLCSHSHNDVPSRTSMERIHGRSTGRRASVHMCPISCYVPILLTTSPRTSAERIHGRSTERRASVHMCPISCYVPILLTTSSPPEPQRNVSIAAVRGAVRPSKCVISFHACRLYRLALFRASKHKIITVRIIHF